MNRFDLLLTKHNVNLRSRWMSNDLSLTRFPTGNAALTYCKRLTRPEAVVGMAMMLGVLEMGWEGSQFRFRFPLPEDSEILQYKSRRKVRRDYRLACKWAANFLITDRMLADLRRDGKEPWELCETECVTPEIVACRMGVILPDDVLEFRARDDGSLFCVNI